MDDSLNKKDLSEADICAMFITPAVNQSGWDEQTQIRREVHFTKGQIHVRRKMVARGKSKFADDILYIKPNIPIAIIEAKDNNHSVGDRMQQALGYAELLKIPSCSRPTATDLSSTTGPGSANLGVDPTIVLNCLRRRGVRTRDAHGRPRS